MANIVDDTENIVVMGSLALGLIAVGWLVFKLSKMEFPSLPSFSLPDLSNVLNWGLDYGPPANGSGWDELGNPNGKATVGAGFGGGGGGAF